MKKVILSAIMIASLFMSIVAYAEPKTFEDTEMNTDSCYVTAFYDIDSLEEMALVFVEVISDAEKRQDKSSQS